MNTTRRWRKSASCVETKVGIWPVGTSTAAFSYRALCQVRQRRAADPLAAIRALTAPGKSSSTSLLVLQNFHRFLHSAEIVQALARQIIAGKQNRTFVVILSPVVQLPVELEKLFVVFDHDLPDRTQLEAIARGIATQECELPAGDELTAVLDSAAGLTRYEAEGAFSLSLVRHGRLVPRTVWELKRRHSESRAYCSCMRVKRTFPRSAAWRLSRRFANGPCSTRQVTRSNGRVACCYWAFPELANAFAKALGRETGRPTLILDIGALLGSLVGQTEQNIRQALKIADAMAPCICFVDELEKALSGVAGSGQTDSGVSARLFGTLLSWMNDHTSDVYLIATCNDISKLPPEFSCAERFDAVVFLDLPSRPEKEAIWQLYLGTYELDSQQARPDDARWTGAEIRSCCRLAALLDLPLVEAARNIVPVATTASESVDRLRAWASGRCLSARPGHLLRSPTLVWPSNAINQSRRFGQLNEPH